MALTHLILLFIIIIVLVLLLTNKFKILKYILIPLICLFSWMVYDSPTSLQKFQEQSNFRKSAVIQNLKDIRTAQVAYKDKYRVYSDNFNSLLNFINNDSIVFIKAIGEVPDSLTEEEALNAGIISRDSIYILVKESIYNEDYLSNRDTRFELDIESLQEVPFSEGENFNIEAGNIEKGKVIGQVFEVSTSYASFLKGIDAKNKGLELNDIIKVGSMNDASINGNWGE